MFRKNRKYFYFSEKKLRFEEIKFFKLKVSSFVVSGIILIMSFILCGNYLVYDFFNLGFDRINKLVDENHSLQSQLTSLSGRIIQLKSDLDRVNSAGDNFRLLVDLPKLEKDELKVGVGGSIMNFDTKNLIKPTSNAVNQLQNLTDELTREILQQKDSYRNIIEKYKYNQKLFSAIPALKPMDGYYPANGFGIRMHPVLGMLRIHDGLDIINDVGTPVSASGEGTVEFAGHSGGGYGIVVVINHGFGYQSMYAHLSKVLVHQGMKVKRGDLIAKSGRTGLVSGPHLHYEIVYKGVKQNPVDYFLDDVSAKEYLRNFAKR
jgi:murein DD-endopeptidase MepM/ murein hydrolase activator NlpD